MLYSGQIILLVICSALVKHAECEQPDTSNNPTSLANMSMPDITAQEIDNAFEYARIRAVKRRKLENNLAKTGRVYSKTEITAEARNQAKAAPRSINLHNTQEQLEDASQYLVRKYNLSKQQTRYWLPKLHLKRSQSIVKTCKQLLESYACEAEAKYRTANGSCNNLIHSTWGMSYNCFDRLLDPDFSDGLSSPRTSAGNSSLPSARLVSRYVDDDKNVTSKRYTHFTMQWGQFLDHDIAKSTTPQAGDNGDIYKCCPIDKSLPTPSVCFPIEVPKDDDFFGKQNLSCMNFVRNAACSSHCQLGRPRQLVSQQTAFIDGSVLYGTTEEQTMDLRELQGGRLKSQNTPVGELLPPSDSPKYDQCSSAMGNYTCFQSGDGRVNVVPGLSVLHTLWMRQHNLIANTLAEENPDATDEVLFQESRRILGAKMQMVAFNELLPVILGRKMMRQHGLDVKRSGFTQYKPNINPTLTVEFAVAAYRLHTLIQNEMMEVNSKGEIEANLDIRSNQFHPISMYEGKMDALLRGMYHQGAQNFDRFFGCSITRHLFEKPGGKFGLDLVAVNIQRGREHGLPGYTKLNEFSSKQKITSFENLTSFMTKRNVEKLQLVYDSVDDIDAYPGGFSETPMKGALVGPTFGHFIANQFHRLKYGDRFYFEHKQQSGSFSKAQLSELRKTTLAEIICASADQIETVTPNVFRPEGYRNSNMAVSCKNISRASLTNWFNLSN